MNNSYMLYSVFQVRSFLLIVEPENWWISNDKEQLEVGVTQPKQGGDVCLYKVQEETCGVIQLLI